MRVLMVGATGNYASLLLPELKKRNLTVRALVRDDGRGAEAKRHGADETVVGDLRVPESLGRATQGVNGVFHIGPAFSPDESQMGIAMVNAAKAAGVQKFVFSGAIHPTISKMKNHANKQPVEEAIYESGMAYTILQPTMFMQTLKNGWQQVAKQGVFALPFSNQVKLCYVDYRDVAEAAAVAFTEDRLAFGTFELCAAGMVNRKEIAAMMSKTLGRNIQATEPLFAEWAEQAGIPEGPMRDGMSRMYANYNQYGFSGGNALALRTILGREPRTLQQYLDELAQHAQEEAA